METVRDIMSRDLVTVEPSATVAEAATVMGGRGVGSALVVDGEAPVGIFTERDVLRALASDFDAAHHPVADWMTHDPVSIEAQADVSVARDLMLERGFRHLPVTDGGTLVGIVSLRDLSSREA
ncbi:MAG TPA: CBS domain-containing protein [Actinomycetota bacterium]|nr:CBS domain-containing protein [Actinomycetota bacterium]